MSIANDSIYAIRASLGDLQGTRWPDRTILGELNRAADRMLAILKRNALDYGQAKVEIIVPAGADEFTLPSDFMGVVGLYYAGKLVQLKGAEELETITASIPLAVWAVDGTQGVVKNAPTSEAAVRLRYWQRPATLTEPASVMPWGGVFDAPLQDYVRMRLYDYDEMNIAQDQALLVDLENNMLTLAISRNPTVKEPKGWLA